MSQTRSLPHHVNWRSFRFSQRCCSRHGSLWDMTAETHSVTSPKIWAYFHILSNSFPTDHSNNQRCSVRATNSAFKLLINTAEQIWQTDRQTDKMTYKIYTKRKEIRTASGRYTARVLLSKTPKNECTSLGVAPRMDVTSASSAGRFTHRQGASYIQCVKDWQGPVTRVSSV